jgi:hypothetical protein
MEHFVLMIAKKIVTESFPGSPTAPGSIPRTSKGTYPLDDGEYEAQAATLN